MAATLVVLACGLTLFGCSTEDAAPPSTQPTAPATPADRTPSDTGPGEVNPVDAGRTGMDVRVLHPDGSTSTLPVRDFPR